ncbi:hypothetical protein NSK_008380 [Nannochloropsis salina CCMP1776]|uniref:EsV-1-7 n=1 Tax=Nannochloropsis salina CCMP1776 TaxID=1027361 RepID=A0A4D9CQA8_9STRA|nr:hypothetical protein NSK_008380 [Nannochloropsis salina CCMP1776]|eukprot:TFJ80237.1 hypothetical protein NSK_008380 [Nannochloropsis salina CCMP1776]
MDEAPHDHHHAHHHHLHENSLHEDGEEDGDGLEEDMLHQHTRHHHPFSMEGVVEEDEQQHHHQSLLPVMEGPAEGTCLNGPLGEGVHSGAEDDDGGVRGLGGGGGTELQGSNGEGRHGEDEEEDLSGVVILADDGEGVGVTCEKGQERGLGRHLRGQGGGSTGLSLDRSPDHHHQQDEEVAFYPDMGQTSHILTEGREKAGTELRQEALPPPPPSSELPLRDSAKGVEQRPQGPPRGSQAKELPPSGPLSLPSHPHFHPLTMAAAQELHVTLPHMLLHPPPPLPHHKHEHLQEQQAPKTSVPSSLLGSAAPYGEVGRRRTRTGEEGEDGGEEAGGDLAPSPLDPSHGADEHPHHDLKMENAVHTSASSSSGQPTFFNVPSTAPSTTVGPSAPPPIIDMTHTAGGPALPAPAPAPGQRQRKANGPRGAPGAANALKGLKMGFCTADGCKKVAIYGKEGARAEFCSKHRNEMEGMVDLINRKCEAGAGCQKRPHYGFRGQRALYCSEHRQPKMINVTGSLCDFGDCVKRASYGWKDPADPGKKRRTRCAAHKEAGMVDVAHRLCEEPGCQKSPYYGYPDTKRALVCAEHQRPMMVSMSRRCHVETCTKLPYYGYEGQKAASCAAHKKDGMLDVVSKKCADPFCRTQPSYAFLGEAPRHCAKHRLGGEVNVVSRRCDVEGCGKVPTYGDPEMRKPVRCRNHREERHVNVAHRLCDFPDGCLTQPSFGLDDGKGATRCTKHKEEGMRDMKSRRCEVEGCVKKPLYTHGGEGSDGGRGEGKAVRCAEHKEEGMVPATSRQRKEREGKKEVVGSVESTGGSLAPKMISLGATEAAGVSLAALNHASGGSKPGGEGGEGEGASTANFPPPLPLVVDGTPNSGPGMPSTLLPMSVLEEAALALGEEGGVGERGGAGGRKRPRGGKTKVGRGGGGKRRVREKGQMEQHEEEDEEHEDEDEGGRQEEAVGGDEAAGMEGESGIKPQAATGPVEPQDEEAAALSLQAIGVVPTAMRQWL